ncbi:hypothetical protein FRC18_011180, partial [Serendipita sp. 400]
QCFQTPNVNLVNALREAHWWHWEYNKQSLNKNTYLSSSSRDYDALSELITHGTEIVAVFKL